MISKGTKIKKTCYFIFYLLVQSSETKKKKNGQKVEPASVNSRRHKTQNASTTSSYVVFLIANCTIRCIDKCDVNNLFYVFFKSLILVLAYIDSIHLCNVYNAERQFYAITSIHFSNHPYLIEITCI